MPRINLLPWREMRREEQKRAFFMQLGVAALVTALVMFGWYKLNDMRLSGQMERALQLRNVIAQVDVKIKDIATIDQERARLQARIDVIRALQESRPLSVRLMDELVFVMPDGVILDSIIQTDRGIEVEGMAQSSARISAFMRNVEDSSVLESPQLHIVENRQAEQRGLSHFRLTFFEKPVQLDAATAGDTP